MQCRELRNTGPKLDPNWDPNCGVAPVKFHNGESGISWVITINNTVAAMDIQHCVPRTECFSCERNNNYAKSSSIVKLYDQTLLDRELLSYKSFLSSLL